MSVVTTSVTMIGGAGDAQGSEVERWITGLAELEALESDNSPRKYSIDDLKRIKVEYKQKLKCLKGGGTNELRQL